MMPDTWQAANWSGDRLPKGLPQAVIGVPALGSCTAASGDPHVRSLHWSTLEQVLTHRGCVPCQALDLMSGKTKTPAARTVDIITWPWWHGTGVLRLLCSCLAGAGSAQHDAGHPSPTSWHIQLAHQVPLEAAGCAAPAMQSQSWSGQLACLLGGDCACSRASWVLQACW